jgi:processive 1,2-diacylglycerol beta-glucosyltransferase
MKTILLLPLFSMPSGHQHVADAIRDHLLRANPQLIVHKVDLLGRGFGRCEHWLSRIYLKWIHHFPKSYGRLYTRMVTSNRPSKLLLSLYRALFLPILESIIRETQPDLIFCTHSLPSYLCGQLKKQRRLSSSVINAYTDFFIHQLWDTARIDYHLFPDRLSATALMQRRTVTGVCVISGIPIAPELSGKLDAMRPPAFVTPSDQRPLVLIAGGHAGAGYIQHLLHRLPGTQCRYLVLCGTNQALQTFVMRLANPAFQALGYVADKAKMSEIYCAVDAVITKAGGVTLSECIQTALPVFVYHALPGQEELNKQHLLRQQMLVCLTEHDCPEQQVMDVLGDRRKLAVMKQNLHNYRMQLLDEHSGEPQVIRILQKLARI